MNEKKITDFNLNSEQFEVLKKYNDKLIIYAKNNNRIPFLDKNDLRILFGIYKDVTGIEQKVTCCYQAQKRHLKNIGLLYMKYIENNNTTSNIEIDTVKSKSEYNEPEQQQKKRGRQSKKQD